jgi:hypothetical protein
LYKALKADEQTNFPGNLADSPQQFQKSSIEEIYQGEKEALFPAQE